MVQRLRQWPKDIQLCCVEVTRRQKCDRAHVQPSGVAWGCSSWPWLPATLSGREECGSRLLGWELRFRTYPLWLWLPRRLGARPWSLFLAKDTAIGRKRLSGSWGQLPGHQRLCVHRERSEHGVGIPARRPSALGWLAALPQGRACEVPLPPCSLPSSASLQAGTLHTGEASRQETSQCSGEEDGPLVAQAEKLRPNMPLCAVSPKLDVLALPWWDLWG